VDISRLVRGLALSILAAIVIAPEITIAGTTTYTYDALGRLRYVTASDGTITTYTHDPAGNRQSVTTAGGGSGGTPTAPTGLSGYSPTHGFVTMSWTASTGGTPPYVYYVEYCTGSTCTNFTFLTTSATASATASGLPYPATNRFRVRARDLSGSGNYGPYSNIAAIVTQ
jgi:YD repeat-containing protein